MKIGVDASCWANKRGYGRYTRELLRALMALDKDSDYRLFLDSATDQQSDDLPEGVQRVVVETSLAAAQAASASGHRSLRDLWAMAQAVRRQGRDLDIFYFPSVYTFFPVMTPAKVVVTVHDTTAERYPKLIFPNRRSRLLWKLKVRWAVHRADLITTVSETSKQEIIREFKLKEGAVRVVPDAVSPAFRPVNDPTQTRQVLAKYNLNGDQRYILYVGGISPHKNLATLVDAYAAATRETGFQDVNLVLVGGFQEDVFYSSYPGLREKIESLGMSDKVIFTGFVSDQELVHFYNGAQVLAIPSYDEGFGLPAAEAMACGTPVVASRAGALPEVVGQAGLLFDPHAPEELKECLQRLIADEGLRKELGRIGLCRAREFSWESSARTAAATFKELVDHHGATAA